MTDAVEGAALASDIAPAAVCDVDPSGSTGERSPKGADRDSQAGAGARRRGPLAVAAGAVWDGARTVAFALLLSFAIRVVIVEPFHIPSESMEPTLQSGDYIGAMKFAYGWSRVSATPVPLPMVSGRLLGREPSRGEIVVFRNPLDGGADYVKRLIGLPGDRVQMRQGVLFINGEPVESRLIESYDGADPAGVPVRISLYEETLPGGCAHQVQRFDYVDGHDGGQNLTQEFLVPAGHYFVMGDNRDYSRDSRLPGVVGFVPAEEIIGRVEFVFMSVEEGRDLPETSGWPTFRLDRMLKTLTCV